MTLGVSVLVWVAVGGALGAVVRWLADVAARRGERGFAEAGVLVANTVASALLGWIAGGQVLLGPVPGDASLGPTLFAGPVLGWDWWLLGAGLAGALSTFSTAVLQVAWRLRAGQWRAGLGLALATWVLGAGAARLAAMLSVGAPSLLP